MTAPDRLFPTCTAAHARLLAAMYLSPTQHRDGRYSVSGPMTVHTHWVEADLKKCNCGKADCVHVSAILLRRGDRTGDRHDFERAWGMVQPPPPLPPDENLRRMELGSFRRVGATPTVGGLTLRPGDLLLRWPAYIVANAAAVHARTGAEPPVVQQDRAKGQHVVICGAGPSLSAAAAEWCPQGDQVWAVHSALPALIDHGHKVTAAVCAFPGPADEMLRRNKWATAPDVEYLLASNTDPLVVEYLLQRGRRLRFFHSYICAQPFVAVSYCLDCGRVVQNLAADSSCTHPRTEARTLAYDAWLYGLLFPPTVWAGSGLTGVPRAIDVAQHMGFERITVLGADCCLPVPASYDGFRVPSFANYLEGEIDGRAWLTKPDMMVSAVWLAQMQRQHPKRIRLVGDTLPNWLLAYRDKLVAKHGKAKGERRWNAFLRDRLPSLASRPAMLPSLTNAAVAA